MKKEVLYAYQRAKRKLEQAVMARNELCNVNELFESTSANGKTDASQETIKRLDEMQNEINALYQEVVDSYNTVMYVIEMLETTSEKEFATAAYIVGLRIPKITKVLHISRSSAYRIRTDIEKKLTSM